MVFCRDYLSHTLKNIAQRWLTISYAALFVFVFFIPNLKAQPSLDTMLVEANQITYDTKNKIMTAIGRVKIYNDTDSLEADKVIYNQATDRMRAIGNVRMTDAKKNIVTGSEFDIEKNFANGFIKAMNLETIDRTFIGSNYGVKEMTAEGEILTFEKATYTACEPCKDTPRKAPFWQIKASKVVHKKDKEAIYFHNARLEVLDVPLFYIPYFWVPDHTAKRKSGFLSPSFSTHNKLGTSVEIPYYYVFSDNLDVTFSPVYYTKQGVMAKGELNYGTDTLTTTLRVYAINQQNLTTFNANSGAFPFHEAPGDRKNRYYIQNSGRYLLSDKWNVNWDIHAFSDRNFMRDYNINSLGTSEANSTIALTGQGDRSFFEAKTVKYQGLSLGDRQSEIPATLPQIDYFKTREKSLLGGEFSFRGNMNILMREHADFDVRNDRSLYDPLYFRNYDGCDAYTPSSVVPTSNNRFDCLLRGVGGTYARLSGEAQWRKRIYDKIGQVWEPFASLRADIAALDLRPNPDVSNYFGNEFLDRAVIARLMPTLGITYRYPWISAQSWGSTTVEPVGQVILRPNEMQIGKMPNEDAQSLVFDDSTLFAANKFSGWDRQEGGGRFNYGLNITTRFNNGAYFNALFGQSKHLFGLNSFTYGDPNNSSGYIDMAGAGANSGLDKPRSDYVMRVQLRPIANFMTSARLRFNESTWQLMRTEIDTTLLYKNISLVASYADYAERPLLGFSTSRKGVGGAIGYKLNQDWTFFTAARYDIDMNRLDGVSASLNYLDDCYFTSIQYSRAFYYGAVGGAKPPDDHRLLLRIGLRTVGDTKYSRSWLQ